MIRNLILCYLLICSVGKTQSVPETEGLHDVDWNVRAATLYRILANPAAMKLDSTKQALIECLEREDKILDAATPDSPGADDEAYGDTYLSALTDSVLKIAQTSDDKRAFDALIRGGYNADSELGKIIAARPESLPTLLDVAKTSGMGQRSSALMLIGTMLRSSKDENGVAVSPDLYRQSKQLLIETAVKPTADIPMRQAATEALSTIADKADLPILQRIAAADTASWTAKNDDGATVTRFPVREEARKGIKTILASAVVTK